jgi:hypothetical protein
MLPVSLDCVVFLRNKAKIQHNPEKLTTQGRQDGEKQNKNTTQSRENDNIR